MSPIMCVDSDIFFFFYIYGPLVFPELLPIDIENPYFS